MSATTDPALRPATARTCSTASGGAANARHLPGSGLGLAIVRDVAESHGGSVSFESPPDGGTRFRLRLGSAGS